MFKWGLWDIKIPISHASEISLSKLLITLGRCMFWLWVAVSSLVTIFLGSVLLPHLAGLFWGLLVGAY